MALGADDASSSAENNHGRIAMHAGFRALIVLVALVATPLHAAVVVSCPANGSGGDLTDRGFYVQNYGAGTLGTVTLQYIAGTAGTYTVSLTANAGAYNGPVIGTATASAAVATSGDTPMTFNFGAAVTPGTTIAFTQVLVSGPGSLFFDTGVGPCPGVIETEGTTPPLDVFRRNSVALAINDTGPVVITNIPIPTLSEWALILLAFALAGIAALRWRSRQVRTRQS
jgi:IPTL-CTERM motif